MPLEGSLKLMGLPDAPPLAYLQGLGTGQLQDDPATVRQYGLTTAVWRKSTHSGGSGSDCLDCLEVLDGAPEVVPVRDSKVSDGPVLMFRVAAWQSFVDDLT